MQCSSLLPGQVSGKGSKAQPWPGAHHGCCRPDGACHPIRSQIFPMSWRLCCWRILKTRRQAQGPLSRAGKNRDEYPSAVGRQPHAPRDGLGSSGSHGNQPINALSVKTVPLLRGRNSLIVSPLVAWVQTNHAPCRAQQPLAPCPPPPTAYDLLAESGLESGRQLRLPTPPWGL